MIAFAMAVAIALPDRSRASAPHLCRTVHGRMMATNGNPGLRIWEVDTRHYLGVDVGQNLSLDTLPANVRRKWIAATPQGSLFEASLFGDFHVCGWKPRRTGEMELVRVISARNLVVGSYK